MDDDVAQSDSEPNGDHDAAKPYSELNLEPDAAKSYNDPCFEPDAAKADSSRCGNDKRRKTICHYKRRRKIRRSQTAPPDVANQLRQAATYVDPDAAKSHAAQPETSWMLLAVKIDWYGLDRSASKPGSATPVVPWMMLTVKERQRWRTLAQHRKHT